MVKVSVQLELRLDELSRKAKFAAYKGIVEALSHAYVKTREIISLSDHTLQDLAAEGHPYSAANPQRGFHTPDESIHVQSGQYLSMLRIVNPTGMQSAIISGEVRNDDNEKDEWLQKGTSKMVARPWAQYVMDKHGREMQDMVIARVGADLQ